MGYLKACGSLVLAVVAMFTVVSPAHAAGLLVTSDPRPKQELADPPGWVTLVFRRDVDRSMAKIVVTNSDGANVAVNALIVEGNNVTTQLRDGLPKGTYTVHYRVDRADGQPAGGAFQFAYGKGSWTSLSDASWSGAAEEPPLMSNPDPRATGAAPTEEPTQTRPPIEVEQSDGATTTPTQVEPTPSVTGTPTATAHETETPSPEPQTTPQGQPEGGSWWPWVLGGAVLAGAGGAGAWLVKRQARP